MVRFALLCALVAACDDGGYYHPLRDTVAAIEVTHDPTVLVTATFRTSKGRLLPEGVVVRTAYRGDTHIISCFEQTDPKTQEPFTSCALQLGEPSVAEELLEVSLTVNEDIAISSLNLPPLFKIDAVTGSISQSPITVTWSPTSGDMMAWSFTAAGVSNHMCSVFGLGPAGSIPDTGMLVIDTSQVSINSNGFPCGVSMSLSRTRAGTMAPELSGGSIRAVQTKSFF